MLDIGDVWGVCEPSPSSRRDCGYGCSDSAVYNEAMKVSQHQVSIGVSQSNRIVVRWQGPSAGSASLPLVGFVVLYVISLRLLDHIHQRHVGL